MFAGHQIAISESSPHQLISYLFQSLKIVACPQTQTPPCWFLCILWLAAPGTVESEEQDDMDRLQMQAAAQYPFAQLEDWTTSFKGLMGTEMRSVIISQNKSHHELNIQISITTVSAVLPYSYNVSKRQ